MGEADLEKMISSTHNSSKTKKRKRKRGATSNDDLKNGSAHQPGAKDPSQLGRSKPSAGSLPDRTENLSSAVTAVLPSADAKSFLTPQDPSFPQHLRTHYKGFVHRPAHQLHPPNFHPLAKIALERLRDASYYQYDIVMAGGKHTSRTFVKRTLVGEPGITYKYLGLRLFAHSWSGPGTSPLMASIGELNQYMIQMTRQLGSKGNESIGRCDYNLTLINYMEPTSHHNKVGFKEEANYGMGKVSVSWHADSSLEKNSSIGVYHCLPTQRVATWDWRIALRPAPDFAEVARKNNVKDAAPLPVVVNTKDGDAYFLLGTFNETHQHCVLAGSQANRISSTHRVAVVQEDTYDYILKRCKIARKRFRLQLDVADGKKGGPFSKLDAKVIRYCQQVLTEVEMEWIAQYWLQGAQHDKMHVWWQRPMKTLEAYWVALEEASCRLYHLCETEHTVPIDVIKVLKSEFVNRQTLRQQWDERRADKIYQRRINIEYRPVARPDFDVSEEKHMERLPKDLSRAVNALSKTLNPRIRGK